MLLNCYVADRSIPSIVSGEVLGGRTATERLIRAGHRRVGLIEGEVWMDASRDRLKGYRQALAHNDIPYDPALVRPGNWEPCAGYEQTRHLMKLATPPTAIFYANDLMALGGYEALKELGLRIPADVAVVGYDDREIVQFLRPPLTTVLLPHFEMGTLAVETSGGSGEPAGQPPAADQGRMPDRRAQFGRTGTFPGRTGTVSGEAKVGSADANCEGRGRCCC